MKFGDRLMGVRMEEAWNRQKDGTNASTGFIIWEVSLRRGSPERELEPPAAYRLEWI
jgi:hypothetical protein